MENKYDVDFTPYVRLDTNSPSGLAWNYSSYSGRHYKIPSKIAGTPAGTACKTAYGNASGWILVIDAIGYKVSRVIWKLIHGTIDPSLVVDHIDGNPLNNELSNLRLVTYCTNSQNKKLQFNNTSGIKGVRKMTQQYSSGTYHYWIAQWTIPSGKSIVKSFSVKKYGDYEAKRMACEWRNNHIEILNKEGSNYTERHCSNN